jgi:hypothetical protein
VHFHAAQVGVEEVAHHAHPVLHFLRHRCDAKRAH